MTAAAPISRRRDAPRTLRLTESLKSVLEQASGSARRGKHKKHNKKSDGKKSDRLTLQVIVDATSDRAFGVLLAFLCLPFLSPITIPFASIPFGAAIALLGLEVAICRTRPWLPQWLLNWKLPQKFTRGLLKFAARIFHPLEKIIHPRLDFMQHPAGRVVTGIAFIIDGLLLALPWPPGIPLTNTIPAWMALTKILGLTERDGAASLIGSILSFAAVAIFVTALIFVRLI